MKIRALAASLIFLSLTVLKLAEPQLACQIKSALIPENPTEKQLSQHAFSLGYILAGEDEPLRVWENAPPPVEETGLELCRGAEGFELESMVRENLLSFQTSGGYQSPEDAESRTPDTLLSEDSPSHSEAAAFAPESEEDGDIEVLMAAFLERQGEFAGCSLPDSVCRQAVQLDADSCRPVTGAVASVFGYRVHPIYGDVRFHYGTDFSVNSGEPIAAFADGTVIAAQEFDGYGLTLIIDHGNGLTSLCAHCSRLEVGFGDTVKKGDVIALVGSTGNVTGPHLHFELQKDGEYLNPEFYL